MKDSTAAVERAPASCAGSFAFSARALVQAGGCGEIPGDGLVHARHDRRVARFVDGLQPQRQGVRRAVQDRDHVAQTSENGRTRGSGERGEHLLEQHMPAPSVAGSQGSLRRGRGASRDVPGASRRRVPDRQLEQLRGGDGRAASQCQPRRLLERVGDGRVRAFCRQREVAGSLLDVDHGRGQLPVQRSGPSRWNSSANSRGQKRVGEGQPLPSRLQDVERYRRVHPLRGHLVAQNRGDEPERRSRRQRDHLGRASALERQMAQPVLCDRRNSPGHWEGFPRFEPPRPLRQGARHLQPQEGVALAGAVQVRQQRQGQAAELAGDDLCEPVDVERTDRQSVTVQERLGSQQRGSVVSPTGGENADRPAAEPSERGLQGPGRGGVQPLHVVDRQQQRTAGRKKLQHAEQPRCDGAFVRRSHAGWSPEHSGLQRCALRHR